MKLMLVLWPVTLFSFASQESALRAYEQRNYGKALREWRRLAEEGNAEAQFRVASMYRNGEGTHPQPSEAAAWYWKAAYQGFSSAQYELGMMCAVGRGIPKNYANAYMWLSLASTSSEDEAAKQRDVIAKEMPAAEITEVQQLVKSWQPAFPVGHGVSAPVIISHVDPEYPEEARRAKISGTVFLQVIIDATGRVRDILVMRGPGHGLEAKAIQAVGQWRFRPGSRNGQPSTTQVPVEVNFNLVTDKR